MDGLASGRHMISPDIPECRLYPDWISIYHSPAEAVGLIQGFISDLEKETESVRIKMQIAFARSNTWSKRAEQLLAMLKAQSN